MYTYTRSKSIYFPNGIEPNQLFNLILNSITTPVITYINVLEENVEFTFDGPLSDETQFNTIIQNYTPIEYNYNVPYLINNVLTTKINNQEYKYFGNEYREIIIAPDSQAHFNTLSAAIAAYNIPNQVFVIYPGTYIESNPIILPEGTTIKSVGSVSNTILVAQDYTQDLIRIHKKCKTYGLTFAGAHGSGARGLYFDASLSNGEGNITVVSECFVVDCDIGVEVDGKYFAGMADTLYAEKLVISATNHVLSKGVFCQGGGQFITSVCYVVGVPGYYPILNAYDCQGDNSKISLSTASVWFCNNGVYLDNNGNAEISLINAQYNNNGVVIGPNGTSTRISTSSLVIKNSTTYDIDIQALNANVEIYSSFLDDSKLNNPNDVNIIVKYNAKVYNANYTATLGDMMIGSAYQPSKIGIGEGLYINHGIVILTNNNLTTGTWIDNTYDALISDPIVQVGGFNIFQNVNPDNCLYIGSDKYIFGFKIKIITPTTSNTSLDDVVWEYWNGSSWVQYNVMQTYPDYPCYMYINSFVSLQSKFHIRFGLTTNTPFALLTLNGMNKYWLRLRVVNTLSSIPIGGYIKLHTNSTRINNDGFIEYFGNARTVSSFNIPFFSLLNSQTLYLNENVYGSNYILTENSKISLKFKMPKNIDISFPLRLNVNFVCDDSSNGNVEWLINYYYVTNNTPLYLTLTDAQNNPNANVITINKTTVLSLNQQHKNKTETVNLDISRIPVNSNDITIFYATLERITGTYPGNIILYHVDCDYIQWSSGSHIVCF